jgi:HK97 family phage major capsid protein
MKTRAQLVEERNYVAALVHQIHEGAAERSLDVDESARFDEGSAFVTAVDAEIDALDAREEQVRSLAASRPQNVVSGDGARFTPPNVIVREDPYDLSDVRFGDTEAVRSKALRALEVEKAELRDDQFVETERLVRGSSDIALKVLTTSSPAYRSGFLKYITGRAMFCTDAERSALERSVTLGTGTADLAVPTILDTTVIDTGTHSTNPIRQVATTKKIGPGASSWNGVSSAGVTASWDGEEAEVSDDAPTLASLSIPVFKGAAFVPFSVESEDWSELESEARRMIAIAKDDLEGAAFVSGNGTTAPQGIATGLDGAGATIEIAPSVAETFTPVADLRLLENSVAPRFRRNAAFMANKVWISLVQAAETTVPVGSLVGPATNGGAGLRSLLGYPLYENPDMDGVAPNAAASADNFGFFFGDFAQGYYIVDRVGLTVEYIPHLFHTTTNRPSGSRGFYAWFRTGAEVVNTAAIHMLSIPTTA